MEKSYHKENLWLLKKKSQSEQKNQNIIQKKDYDIAKIAIRSMEQKKWASAEKTAKKAKDKSIYNFIRWKHLLTTGNQLAFYEYKRFIELKKNDAEKLKNPQWMKRNLPFTGELFLGHLHLIIDDR